MCGRYTLASTPRQLAEHFSLDRPPSNLTPRYNIAPSQQVAIARELEGVGRHVDLVRWGLIPSWSKDPAIGTRMINARAETLADKPAFRAAFRSRRCLVLADGFYEWKKLDGRKQPYWIGLQNRRPLAFAGLWEHWESPAGELVESCAIITSAANELVREIHDRMPVILPPDSYEKWLAEGQSPGELACLLTPFPASGMIAYAVARSVNNPSNDTQDLLLPVTPEN